MTSQDLIQTICRVLCKALTRPQAEEILSATIPLTVPANGLIIREGDEGAGLYLLLAGRADILKLGPEGAEQQIATVEAPTVLGELSLVTESIHSATARALTDCELRLLRKEKFRQLLEADNLAAHKLVCTIAGVMARRLLKMDEKVVELLGRRDGPPPVEELARFKHKLFSEWSF